MENPRFCDALIIAHICLMQANKLSKELDQSYIENLLERIASWISKNWGTSNYEANKENFLNELTEEIKNI